MKILLGSTIFETQILLYGSFSPFVMPLLIDLPWLVKSLFVVCYPCMMLVISGKSFEAHHKVSVTVAEFTVKSWKNKVMEGNPWHE